VLEIITALLWRKESFFPCDFQSLQKVVKRDDGDVILGLGDQQGLQFCPCCVGMFGDEWADFLFVGFEFWSVPYG
jgi:hypothetical protein